MTLLKRTTHKPEGFREEQMQGFSLLSHKASAIAITNRLTGSQFRLWHYLMMIDPFADQTSSGERIYHDIPSPPEIGIAIGSNTRTVEKDMKRLEELGLYTKRVMEWQGYNLTAEQARHASEVLKAAKAERSSNTPIKQPKTPKPLQNKGGYLAGNPVILPKVRLNSRDSGKITGGEMAETQTGQKVQAPAISPQTFQIFQTSSDLDEEGFKTLNKEKEVSQGDVVGTEGVSISEPLTTLADKKESVTQPKDPDVDRCSAASCKNENQSHKLGDAAILKWLVEVKIPSLELDEPPRNPEAYARGMLKRDGNALRVEFEEILGDRQFQSRCTELTEKVEARADEWRKAGIPLTVFWDSSGMPAVIMNGSAIAANDFLLKPIEPPAVRQIPDAVRANSENRKARQSRLKCAGMIGECPGLEFLIECWGDVLLQAQIKALIAKHPEWGIWVEQLCEFVT